MNFDMHGFSSGTVAILVDGLPFEEMYDGGGGDISRILVMNASKIVVNRGTSSALYGSRGAFGAINVVFKRPERLFFDASTEVNNWGSFSVNSSGGGVYKDFYLLLSVSMIKENSYKVSSALTQNKRMEWLNKLVPYAVYGYTPVNTIYNSVGQSYLYDEAMWTIPNHPNIISPAKPGMP